MKEGEEREKSGEKGGGAAKHASTVCICAPAFVSLAAWLITFIEPDQELKRRFEAATGSFPVCAVNAGCGAEIKPF